MVKLHSTGIEIPASLGRDLLRDHRAELAEYFGPGSEVRESADALQSLDTTVGQDVQRVGQQLARGVAGRGGDVPLPVVAAQLLDLGHAIHRGWVEEDLVPVTEVLGPQRHPRQAKKWIF